MAKKKKETKDLELILLGIIAILAIVGLVMMFNKAGIAGNATAATGGQQQGMDPWESASARRAGELSQPAQWGQAISALERDSDSAERKLDRYPTTDTNAKTELRYRSGQFDQN